MDSGAFLDVIPLILKHLDLKSLIQLSCTCCFWRDRIYYDLKLWSNYTIELPYIGRMQGGFYGHNSCESALKAKLWSMIMPPEDPKALEKVLEKMSSSEEGIQRFQLVENVDFKNYIHTDESLRLTAQLFPSLKQISFEGILFTITGVEYIAKYCQKLKHIEFYACDNLDLADTLKLFNTKEHELNLERIFIPNIRYRTREKCLNENVLPFMAFCGRCGLYFNEVLNKTQMLCLYHPGTYSGYGHSCSSFSCCGSNTPDYPSTLGCQYTYHTKNPEELNSNMSRHEELHRGLPEYMFRKFDYKMFALDFTRRRRLDSCYREWNKE